MPVRLDFEGDRLAAQGAEVTAGGVVTVLGVLGAGKEEFEMRDLGLRIDLGMVLVEIGEDLTRSSLPILLRLYCWMGSTFSESDTSGDTRPRLRDRAF